MELELTELFQKSGPRQRQARRGGKFIWEVVFIHHHHSSGLSSGFHQVTFFCLLDKKKFIEVIEMTENREQRVRVIDVKYGGYRKGKKSEAPVARHKSLVHIQKV